MSSQRIKDIARAELELYRSTITNLIAPSEESLTSMKIGHAQEMLSRFDRAQRQFGRGRYFETLEALYGDEVPVGKAA